MSTYRLPGSDVLKTVADSFRGYTLDDALKYETSHLDEIEPAQKQRLRKAALAKLGPGELEQIDASRRQMAAERNQRVAAA